jgi:hypothetical protein
VYIGAPYAFINKVFLLIKKKKISYIKLLKEVLADFGKDSYDCKAKVFSTYD